MTMYYNIAKTKLLFLAVLLLMLSTRTYSQTVSTDKLDYLPFETVKVTGTGWAPYEVVNLLMDETPDHGHDLNTSTLADEQGNFTLDLYEIQENDLGSSFVLTAQGETSLAVASTAFTDAVTKIDLSQMHDNGQNVTWEHGNAHDECQLREGYSQAYTLELKGAVENKEIRLVLKYDKLKGDVNAFDFITSYNQHPNGNNIDPTTTGPSWSGAPDDQHEIENTPSHLTPEALARLNDLKNQGLTKISVWNANLTSAKYIAGGTAYEQYIEIKFTVDDNPAFRQYTKDVLVSWGAHLSRAEDWSGKSSGTIPGSPFHMQIEDIKYTEYTYYKFDNGERDRSLKLCEQPKPCDVTIDDYAFELDCDMDVLPEGRSVVAYQSGQLIDLLPDGWMIHLDNNAQIDPFSFGGIGVSTYTGTIARVDGSCVDPFKIEITKEPVVSCGRILHEDAPCDGKGSITIPEGYFTAVITLDDVVVPEDEWDMLMPGTYVVTISQEGYCDYVEEIEITTPDDLKLEVSTMPISCYGETDGKIAFADDMGATITVKLGETEVNDIESLAAGEYSVHATKEGYCPFDTIVNVGDAPKLEALIEHTEISCYGETDATISISTNEPFTKIKVDGNTYDPNMTYGHGPHTIYIAKEDDTCPFDTTIFIECPRELKFANCEYTEIDCFGGYSMISFMANIEDARLLIKEGDGEFENYDPNNNEYPAGTYTLRVEIDGGNEGDTCYKEKEISITQPDLLELDGEIELTSATQDGDCMNGAATIYVQGGTLPYTYMWSHDENLNSNTAENLSAGEYKVHVKDANECEFEESFTILCPRIEIEVNPYCNDDIPYLYYKVTLTDFEGNYPPLRIAWLNEQGDSVNYEDDIIINSDMVEGDLLWAGASLAPDWPGWELDNGVWVEQYLPGDVRDGKIKFSINPTVIEDVDYPLPSPDCVPGPDVELFTVKEDNPCYGDESGSIDLTVTGGYGPPATFSYEWTTVDGSGLDPTAEDQTGLSAGTYKVTVTETHPEVGVLSVTMKEVVIEEPIDFDFELVGKNKSCFDVDDDGEIDLIDHAGNITAYQWTTLDGSGLAPTAEDQTGLSAGTYYVTVYANNYNQDGRCEAYDSVTITEPEEITLDLDKDNATCYEANDGKIYVTTNAESYVIYNESDEDVTEMNENGALPVGTYTVVATSADGNQEGECSVEEEIEVEGPTTPLVFTYCELYHPTCNNPYGKIEVAVSDENAVITVNGDPYDENNEYAAGEYVIVAQIPSGRDGIYCEVEKTVELLAPTTINWKVNRTNPTCYGRSDGKIEVLAEVGGITYTLQQLFLARNFSPVVLLNNAPYDPNNEYPANVEYELSIILVYNNIIFCHVLPDPFMLEEPELLEWVYTSSTNVSCYGDMDGTITVEVSDEDAVLTISKNNGPFEPYDPNATYGAGSYKVVADNGSDCPIECVFHICEPSPINLVVEVTHVSCHENGQGKLNITAVEGAMITVNGAPYDPDMAYPEGEYEIVAEFYGAKKGSMCSEDTIVTIHEPVPLLCNLELNGEKQCFGFWNLMTSNVTGGFGEITFTWEIQAYVNGQVDENIDMAAYGWILKPVDGGENLEFVCGTTYSAIITLSIVDENGCVCGCISDLIEPCSEDDYEAPQDEEGEQPEEDNLTAFDSYNSENKVNLSSYPNPFVSNATISFSVPKSTTGTLTIYSADGTPQEIVFDGNINANEVYEHQIDASRYGNQVLIYILKTADEIFYGKMIPSSNNKP